MNQIITKTPQKAPKKGLCGRKGVFRNPKIECGSRI